MSTKFLSPGWRMPRNANQSKFSNYSLHFTRSPLTRVHLGDALNFFIGSFSASMWVKSPDNGKEFFSRYISANGVGNFRIGCGANTGTANAVSLMTTGGNALLSGSTDIIDGNWHHVCVTMDAISSTQYTRTIYVDGSQDAQDTVGLATYVSTSSSYGLNLGCNFPNNGHNTVDMSQVSIFDYALSPSQVTTLWGGGTSVSNPMALPSPPIAYYPLGTSAWNGQYLAENNAIGDYVFDFGTFTSNDRIVINDTFDTIITGTNFTISSWINLDSVLSNQIKFIFTNESLQLTITDKITTYLRGASGYFLNPFNSNTTLTTGKWYNVVFVKSGSDYTYYLNGSADGTVNNSTSVVNSSQTTSIIGMYYSGSYGFDGKMSNVQIWNKELIDSEVETLYNYGSPIQTLANIPQSSNLKAWYKLDASEIYNNTTTEWEVNDATAAIKTTNLANPGSNYYNNSGNNLVVSGSTAFTVSTWFYASTTPSAGQTIVLMDFPGSSGNNIYLVIQSDSKIRAIINNYGSWSIGNTVTLNQWNLIALTWDSSVTASERVKFYINGQPAGFDNTGADTVMRQSTGARISAQGSSTYPSKVLSSNAITWNNVALSSSEVLTLYNSFSPANGIPTVQPSSTSGFPQNSNITGWFKLDGNGLDSSGSLNNALPVGSLISGPSLSNNNGESSGMTQANLVQSDLQTVAPYSKYAMNFLGTDNDYIDCGNSALTAISGGSNTLTTSMTLSTWFKLGSSSASKGLIGFGDLNNNYGGLAVRHESGVFSFLRANQHMVSGGYSFSDTTNWHNMVFVYDPNNAGNCKVYIDSVNVNLSFVNVGSVSLENKKLTIGAYYGLSDTFTGELSNFSTWNTTLTSAQVSEIYNQGLPSNLNFHSAYSNLVSWWQLGENSSFTGDWIFADEKGSNNGDGQNMTEANLTNGVGTTANGVSSGMAEGNLVGDAPYSTANALSTNMIVTSRVSGVSDAAITTGGTGYVTGTNIATTGGSGTNCTINITTVSGGVITAITINNGGSNYVIGDVLTISGGNGNATITVSGLNTP